MQDHVIPLTIVLPTHNGASFLEQQVDSILRQTRPDFSLVVLDDGSTDDTPSIIDAYVQSDSRVRRLPSSENLGQRARLRQLLDQVSTKFVAFADQDDIWHPDRNALLLDAIGDRAIAFGRSQLVDGEGRDLGRSILEEFGIDPTRAGPLGSLFRSLVSAHAALVRREWLDVAIFSSPVPFDWQMSVEALLSLGAVYVDRAVVHHRIHGGNQSNSRAVRSRPTILSRHNLRANTSFVWSDRLYFFLFIDHLSRSMALSADVRRAFRQATEACRYVWYQPLDFGSGKGRQLEQNVHHLLDRFATSEEDLAYFTKRLRSITRSQLSPVNIIGSFARHLGHKI